jgi:FkbM family methyltransferase
MSVHDHTDFIRRVVANGMAIDTVFDVGANIGGWSRQMRRVLPSARIEMFEPLAGRHADLDARACFGEVGNSRLHPVALSDRREEAKIKVLGDRGVGSSILLLESDFRKETRFITVPVWPMDEYVREHGLPRPDFIKLDTQASELKILAGAKECLRSCKLLLVETWMRRVYGPQTPLFHELAAFLYPLGFNLYEILSLEEGRDPDRTLRWFDAVFIRRECSPFPASLL